MKKRNLSQCLTKQTLCIIRTHTDIHTIETEKEEGQNKDRDKVRIAVISLKRSFWLVCVTFWAVISQTWYVISHPGRVMITTTPTLNYNRSCSIRVI